MAIPQNQLETWSHQGSITQSSSTYQSLKNVLEAPATPYAKRLHKSFLQGSYGNSTNIWADSDVDIVMQIDSVFYKDVGELPPGDLELYNAAFSSAEYTYADFKRDVLAVLLAKYGNLVETGNKAIFVGGNGGRRDADVLVAAQYRKYWRYRGAADQSYTEGLCFWDSSDRQIVNYPKIHSANCVTKHADTNQWFKPTVRIFKNMRNRMIQDGYIAAGLAPSYFVEGMLYNVPATYFGTSYEDSVVGCINWLLGSDKAKLVCANKQYFLLHPTSPVTWRAENLDAFLSAAVRFWKEW
ncbi:nucleotidyltransferase [Sphingorhabdus sp. EL138]|uniref:nucleotidyltransferase domain-containing protein n=1 Tax=Sphingorhabdus sp. EL138 TaxID=2073156 RepID=UPI000D68F6C7|nr:nucleotidyltransferase [Sphingorhabdus sp. EL138]